MRIRRISLGLAFLCPGFAQLSFEVASIKPASPDAQGTSIRLMPGGGLNMTNIPLMGMITEAYNVRAFQVIGGPAWMRTERFDLTARAERTASDAPDDFAKMTDQQRKTRREETSERLRALLADRFQLTAHKETREQPIYALMPAKNGPKLQEAKEIGPRQGMNMGRGRLQGFAAPMEMLATILSNVMGRPVIDKTGISGKYDFVLEWTPDVGAGAGAPAPALGDGGSPPPTPPGETGPTIFTAIQEQLGLRLDSQKGPVEVIVIDRVEKPSEN